MVFKFLVWLKFHLNFDFCCAIAPRKNKTGVDIIDQIFLSSKEQNQVCPVARCRFTQSYQILFKQNKVAKVARPFHNCCVNMHSWISVSTFSQRKIRNCKHILTNIVTFFAFLQDQLSWTMSEKKVITNLLLFTLPTFQTILCFHFFRLF